jgi:hypothetical protein
MVQPAHPHIARAVCSSDHPIHDSQQVEVLTDPAPQTGEVSFHNADTPGQGDAVLQDRAHLRLIGGVT